MRGGTEERTASLPSPSVHDIDHGPVSSADGRCLDALKVDEMLMLEMLRW